MDPVIAIGLTGSVLGIIDVVTKSVQTLQNLQGKYKRADLTASLLIGQLSTLKAALFQISDLVNMDLVKAPQHHQLVADLTISLDCCGLLIRILDDRLQDLQREEHGALRAVGKAKLVWEEKDMVDIRNHLNHQTNALNLLLTASQCRSLFEQVNLLRSDESRRVFKLVKDDTSSLLWLRDAESCYTQRSAFEETLDMIDSTFDFDRELFGSKAYLVASQSNMRHAIAGKPATVTQNRSPSSSPSRDIFNRLVANNDDNDVDAIRQCPASPQSPRVEHRASYEEHSQPSGKQKDSFSQHTKHRQHPTAIELTDSIVRTGLVTTGLASQYFREAPTVASSLQPGVRKELDAVRNRLRASGLYFNRLGLRSLNNRIDSISVGATSWSENRFCDLFC